MPKLFDYIRDRKRQGWTDANIMQSFEFVFGVPMGEVPAHVDLDTLPRKTPTSVPLNAREILPANRPRGPSMRAAPPVKIPDRAYYPPTPPVSKGLEEAGRAVASSVAPVPGSNPSPLGVAASFLGPMKDIFMEQRPVAGTVGMVQGAAGAVEKIGQGDLSGVRGAMQEYVDHIGRQSTKPAFDTAIESGRDVLMAPVVMAQTAANTLMGNAPPGWRGPYSADDALKARGEQGAGMVNAAVGAIPAQAAAVAEHGLGTTVLAAPVDAAMTVMPALGVAKKLAPRVPMHKVWDRTVGTEQRAMRGTLDEAVKDWSMTPEEADAAMARRYPHRARIVEGEPSKAPPMVDKAAKLMARGLAAGVFGADYVGALPAAALGVGASEMLNQVFARATPRTKAWLNRAAKAWWSQSNRQATEIARAALRAPEEVKSEIGLLMKELGARVERGEVKVKDGEPAPRPAATVEAHGVLEDGELVLDPEAQSREAATQVYAADTEGVVAGSRAGRRVALDRAAEIQAPFKRDAASESARARQVGGHLREELKDLRGEAQLAVEDANRLRARASELRASAREKGASVSEAVGGGMDAGAAAADHASGAVKRVSSIADQLSDSVRATSEAAKQIRKDMAAARTQFKEMKSPEGKAALRGLIDKQRALLKDMADGKKVEQHIRRVVDEAAKEGRKWSRQEVADARKMLRSWQRHQRKVVADMYALSKVVRKQGSKLRKDKTVMVRGRVADLEPLRSAYEDHRNMAKHLRRQADDASQVERAVARQLDDEAWHRKTLIEEDDLATEEGRLKKSGARFKESEPTPVMVELTGEGEKIQARIHELLNQGRPPKKRFDRKTTDRWVAESMSDDSLSLLRSPRMRGFIYKKMAQDLGLTGSGTYMARKKFFRQIDKKMVELVSDAMTNEPSSLQLALPNGKKVDLRTAIRDVIQSDDPRVKTGLLSMRKEALERTGQVLGTQAQKSITARRLGNEYQRFRTRDSGDLATDLKHATPEDLPDLIGKGGPPLIADAGVVRQLPLRDHKHFVDMPKKVRDFIEGEGGVKLEADVKIDKGFLSSVQAQMDSLGMFEELSQVNKALRGASRLAKLSHTAYNTTTHVNNLMGNLAVQSVSYGMSPLTVLAEWTKETRNWQRMKSGKMKGAELDKYRALVATGGFDTTAIDDVAKGFTLQHAQSELPGVGAAKNLGRSMERIYRGGDTVPKLHDASKRFDVIKKDLGRLREGYEAHLDLKDGVSVHLVKRGGELYANGKKLTRAAEDRLVARSAIKGALDRFVDYSAGGMYEKAIRSQKSLLTFAAPYYSWLHRTTDIPGVKKGLFSTMLSEAGVGIYKTNDPALIARNFARASKVALKRMVLVSVGRSLMDKHRHLIGEASDYTPGTTRGAIGWMTNNPLEVDVMKMRGSHVWAGAEAVWRMGHAGAGVLFKGRLKGKYDEATSKVLSGWIPSAEQAKELARARRLWRKAEAGQILNPADALAQIGFGHALIGGIVEELSRPAARGGPRWDRAGVDFARLFMGDASVNLAQLAKSAVDPYDTDTGRRQILEPMTGPHGPEPFVRYAVRKMFGVVLDRRLPYADNKRRLRAALAKFKSEGARLKKRIQAVSQDSSLSDSESESKVGELTDKRINLSEIALEIQEDMADELAVAYGRGAADKASEDVLVGEDE